MEPYPGTREELFYQFIKSIKFVIYEVGSPSKECKKLYEWACWFAKTYDYNEPTKEECGIYYDDDED